MIKESRCVVLLQAAQKNDPDIAGEMTEEERKQYEAFLKGWEYIRENFGPNVHVDIPYSL